MRFLILSTWFVFSGLLSQSIAHPMPDIPVRTHLADDGSLEIRVEIDPRAFATNPEEYEYETKAKTDATTPGEFVILVETANRFVSNRVKFIFESIGEQTPDFTWTYQKLGDAGPLVSDADPAVMVGSWKFAPSEPMSGYQIESLLLKQSGALPMNVNFFNFKDGVKMERYAVLFPGEVSFIWEPRA
jgi:hypothetical protein